MIELPYIPRYKYGIQPVKRAFNKDFILCGFDTEFSGTGQLNIANTLLSVQISQKEGNWISPIDWKKQEFITPGFANLDLFRPNSFIGAHNLSVDLSALLGDDLLKFIKLKKLGPWTFSGVIDGAVSWATFSKREGKHKECLTFTDTGNWFGHVPLDKLADIYTPEIPKMEKPYYLGERGPKTELEYVLFRNYALRDAEICFKLMQIIKHWHDLGGARECVTPAGLSSYIFRKKYLKNPLYFGSYTDLKFIWQTYHGGRFECFTRGRVNNVSVYDINSLYPFSASVIPLPFSTCKLQLTDDLVPDGWYSVEFKFKDSVKFPCLPVIKPVIVIGYDHKGRKVPQEVNKLLFPLMGFSYCTGHELIEALPYLEDLEILAGYTWDQTDGDIDNPLRKFMLDYYARKKEIDEAPKDAGNMIERTFIKLVMNSLPGKLSERKDKYTKKETAGTLFYPYFSTLILGKARSILAHYINQTDRVHYCDTDSIAINGALPVNTEMGGMKLEAKGDACFIRGKLYFIRNEGEDLKLPIIGSQKLVKVGKHGFRIAGEQAYNNFLKADTPYVDYTKYPYVTTVKQSAREGSFPNKFITRSFRISLGEDGKREYLDSLETPKDLLEYSTFSRPLSRLE